MRWQRGATRYVLVTKRWVFKLPRWSEWRLFLGGLLANMQERLFWTTKDERLCPVVFYIWGGWLVVMPRCDWPVIDDDLMSDSYWDGLPYDPNPTNFGYYKGRIVLIDYGS
jgi:hypothetical protein